MLQIILREPHHFVSSAGDLPQPKPGEALVRVHRIGICGTDLHAFAGRQPFFNYPRILGHELGVEVIDPGDSPHGLRPGDRCAVEPYFNCGRCIACRRGKPNCCTSLNVLGVHSDGGMQPFLAVPAGKLHRSATLDYEQLALVEPLAIGAHAVERAGLEKDDFVLVVGAGPIGLSVVEFALFTGASVAVLDQDEPRLVFCREKLGVCHTLTPQDGKAGLMKIGGDLPTAIIDATGNAGSMSSSFDRVAHGGRVVFVGLHQGEVTFNDPNFHRRELTLLASRNALPKTFGEVISRLERGQIDAQKWITHHVDLSDVPSVFPRSIAGNRAVLKAMIRCPIDT